MGVPEEIIKVGSITIYSDSDTKIVGEIKSHNDYMWECRTKMKYIKEIKYAYFFLNPLMIFILIFTQLNNILHSPVLAIIILVIYSVIYVKFVLFENDLLISTIAISMFLFIDFRFAILLLADAILCYMYFRLEKPLKSQRSFPSFNDIQVKYVRGKISDYNK